MVALARQSSDCHAATDDCQNRSNAILDVELNLLESWRCF